MKSLVEICEGFFQNVGKDEDVQLAKVLQPNTFYKVLKARQRDQDKLIQDIVSGIAQDIVNGEKVVIETGMARYIIYGRNHDDFCEYKKENLDGTPYKIQGRTLSLTPGPRVCGNIFLALENIIFSIKEEIKDKQSWLTLNPYIKINKVYLQK